MTELKPVSVAWRARPFDGRVHQITIDPYTRPPTLAGILGSLENLPRGFLDIAEVRINGDLVPRQMWPHVRPRPQSGRDIAVTLTVPLQGDGGGGGNKNPLATILTIAVLLTAAAVSGGALGFGAIGFLSAGAVNAVAGAAVGIAGALLVGALFPPPTLAGPTQQANQKSAGEAKPASLSGNALAPGSPLPRVLGTMRVFPPYISPPLIEIIGELEYAEAIFGLAGPHAISDLQVGGVDISTMPEITTEIQDGTPTCIQQSLVARQGYTTTPNVTLTRHNVHPEVQFKLSNVADPDSCLPQWHGIVSRKAADEVWVTLAFPEGLFSGDDPTTARTVPVRARLRRRGDTSWINCPEVHFASLNSSGAFQKDIRFKWGDSPVAPNRPPTTWKGAVYAFKHVPVQAVASPAGDGWDADSSFSSGAGNDYLSQSTTATSKVLNTELFEDKAIFYLDPDTFAQDVAYEIQIMRGTHIVADSFTASTYSYTNGFGGAAALSGVFDFFSYQIVPADEVRDPGAPSAYQIASSQANFYDKVIVTRVASVWNQNPVQSSDFATISVRVHSRQVDQFSCLASGYVYDYDGANWATYTTTSKPAPHFRDVLVGPLGGSPLPVALVDDTSLIEWRTHCIAMGYTVNAVVEGRSYVDVLKMLANVGYAQLRHSETWGVFLDKDRSAETPIQIFTPRNMRQFTWVRAFPNRPTGIRASYINSEDEYNTAEIIVYDDDQNEDATRLEQIQYDGLVTEGDVAARAAFDLAQTRSRFTFYNCTTDLESLVSQRGDLVAVQHDILMEQAGFARITSVQTSGSTITGVTLDGTVPVSTYGDIFSTGDLFAVSSVFLLGTSTGLAIRLRGGSGFLVKEIVAASNDDVTVVSFKTPFADPGTTVVDGVPVNKLDPGCQCSSGPLGTEYRRLLVFSVVPQPDMTAQMTFVDEAPELWN